MTKISLEMAKQILKSQGLEIQVSLKEALLERFWIIEDIKARLDERVEDGKFAIEEAKSIQDNINRHINDVESDFEVAFDDNDLISDIYWEIIDLLIDKYNPDNSENN